MLLRVGTRNVGGARLGVTASRKVGCAVVRNRSKRLVREAFRATRPLWSPEIDLVIIVRRFDQQWSLGDITEEWSRAGAQIRRGVREALADCAARGH
jgi:ribonuclease P protein component